MSAYISECGKYRYDLHRLAIDPALVRKVKPIIFIMLNPSTADAEKDDPTIRRCLSFARREGCSHLRVYNLFALRATNPSELKKAENPEGDLNDSFLEEALVEAKEQKWPVIAAWGANELAFERGEALVRDYGPFLCLGLNRNFTPKHPLYVPNNAPLVEYKWKETRP